LGDLFGGLKYSAVSKVNQRFAEKLKKDKRLRRRVENVIGSMSYFEGRPLFPLFPFSGGTFFAPPKTGKKQPL
jgi:hypothetical protein